MQNKNLISLVFFLLSWVHIAVAQNAAVFPGALATDKDLLVATNRASTTLTSSISSSDTSLPVASSSVFTIPSGGAIAVTIESERIKICSASDSTHLTVCTSGRGFDGSVAATHGSGSTVSENMIAWHHNQLEAEVKALENSAKPSVNVKSAGALCDGTTDDSAAIQTAINTAVSNGTNRVYFPTGTCAIGGATTGIIYSLTQTGLEIFGGGPGVSIIRILSRTLTGNVTVFDFKALSRQSFHDLTIQIDKSGWSGAFGITPLQADQSRYTHFYNLEVSGGYGSTLIASYSQYNLIGDVNTTLGTTIIAGTQTVTPGSMAGIYVGQRLYIDATFSGNDVTCSGSCEQVFPTAITATTFTAVFANGHNSTVAVASISQGAQNILVENFYLHDCLATCDGVGTSGTAQSVFRNGLIVDIGDISDPTHYHGIYHQGGRNLWQHITVIGSTGYNFHFHKGSASADASGDVVDGCWSIDPQTGHFVVDSNPSDGTNPEFASGVPLTRYITVQNSHFLMRKGKANVTVIGLNIVDVPASIIGNDFEDTSGGGSWIACGADSSMFCTISGNTLRMVNTTTQAATGIVIANGAATGNILTNWSGGAGIESTNGAPAIEGNYIQLVTGANIGIQAASSGTRIVGNYVSSNFNGGALFGINTGLKGVEVASNRFESLAGGGGNQYVAFLTGAVTAYIHDNDWSPNAGASSSVPGLNLGGTTPSKDLMFVSNKGMIVYGGQPSGVPILNRTTGRLIDLPVAAVDPGQNLLVKLNGSGAAVKLTTSDTQFVAISFVNTGGDASVTAYFAGQPGTEYQGLATDGAWTTGNVGIPSTTAAAKIHDTGGTVCPPGYSCVQFLDTGASIGNARVLVLNTKASTVNGHALFGGPAPSLTSCGTSTLATGASDNAATINVIGTVTSCVFNFGTSFTNAPTCTVSDDSLTIVPDLSVPSTSAVTLNFSASLGGGHAYLHCF